MKQCPYIHDSAEPYHSYNCAEEDGHKGPHRDYMGDQRGLWYVKPRIICPHCGLTISQDDVGYAEPFRPEVRQK